MRDTKDRVLDAAQDLVQRIGANAMSYQHLSDAVGIKKASIHHHFPTKDDLLAALIERYHTSFLGIVRRIAAAPGSGARQLKCYAALFEATLAESDGSAADAPRACPCGMLGAEIATLAPAAAARLRAFYRDNADLLAEILQRGRADGSLAFRGEPRELAWLVFSLLEGGLFVARVDGGLDRFRRLARQLERLLGI